MGAVLVLTPLVISSWPAITAAVAGAAGAMGFAIVNTGADNALARSAKRTGRRTVETEIENSEIVAESLERGQTITIQKDDLTIAFGQDDRGGCTVCVTGEQYSEKELRQIGQDVAGRVVQQFTYHKLMTELKRRQCSIVEEKVMQDESIQVRVRL